MPNRCDFCFKVKTPLEPPIRGIQARVCKGCFYDIDRVLGFLEHYGFTQIGQAAMPFKPPKPPKTTKSKSSQIKKETGGEPPVTS